MPRPIVILNFIPITDEESAEPQEDDMKQMSSEYQHVKDPKSRWDAQTVDAATQEQTQETQAVPAQEEGEEMDDEEEDVAMEEEKDEEQDVSFSAFLCVLGFFLALFLF